MRQRLLQRRRVSALASQLGRETEDGLAKAVKRRRRELQPVGGFIVGFTRDDNLLRMARMKQRG